MLPKKRTLHPQNSPISSGSSSSGVDDGQLPKEKDTRRASEKKRRDEVNLCMDELITLLTMSGDRSCPKRLDKASVLKECCRFVRFYHNLSATASEGTEKDYKPSFITRGRAFSDLLDSLDAFSFVVSRTGQILFATEMMLSCLGFTHRLMVGHSINEFLHREDCAALGELFTEAGNSASVKRPNYLYPSKQVTCRFRLNTEDSRMGVSCILMTFTSYIYMRTWSSDGTTSSDSVEEPVVFEQPESKHTQDLCLILVAIPSSITHRDVPLLSNDFSFVFQLRISKEGTVLDLDKHSSAVLGYTQDEMLGSSLFEYVHPYHVASFGESMSMFIEQGYGSTNPFRLSSKGGRWIWVTSNGYATYNPWNQKGEHVMLECKVLGIDEVDAKQKIWVDSNYVPKINPINTDTLSYTKTTSSWSTANTASSDKIASLRTKLPMSSETGSLLSKEELTRQELERQLQEKNKELFESKQKILEQQRELYEEKDRFQRLLNVTLKIPDQSSGPEQDSLSEFLLSSSPLSIAPPLPAVSSPPIPYNNIHHSSSMHHLPTVTPSPFNNQQIVSANHSKHNTTGAVYDQAQERLLRLIDGFPESSHATYSLESDLRNLVNNTSAVPSSTVHSNSVTNARYR